MGINLYDTSIILNNEKDLSKTNNDLKKQTNNYLYRINHLKIAPLSKTKSMKYDNARALILFLNLNVIFF